MKKDRATNLASFSPKTKAMLAEETHKKTCAPRRRALQPLPAALLRAATNFNPTQPRTSTQDAAWQAGSHPLRANDSLDTVVLSRLATSS